MRRSALLWIDRAGMAAGAASCAILCLLTIGAIVYRLLGYPFYWAAEYSTFFLVFLVLLPLGRITRDDAHLKADFLIQAIGGDFERIVRRYVAPALMLLFALVLLLIAGNRIIAVWSDGIRSNGPLRTPLVIPQTVMMIGLAGMFLAALAQLLLAPTLPAGDDANPDDRT